MSKQGVTIREAVRSPVVRYEERFFSDDEIRDLFSDDQDTIVIALLNRAQESEAERDAALADAERWRHLSESWVCEVLAMIYDGSDKDGSDYEYEPSKRMLEQFFDIEIRHNKEKDAAREVECAYSSAML